MRDIGVDKTCAILIRNVFYGLLAVSNAKKNVLENLLFNNVIVFFVARHFWIFDFVHVFGDALGASLNFIKSALK